MTISSVTSSAALSSNHSSSTQETPLFSIRGVRNKNISYERSLISRNQNKTTHVRMTGLNNLYQAGTDILNALKEYTSDALNLVNPFSSTQLTSEEKVQQRHQIRREEIANETQERRRNGGGIDNFEQRFGKSRAKKHTASYETGTLLQGSDCVTMRNMTTGARDVMLRNVCRDTLFDLSFSEECGAGGVGRLGSAVIIKDVDSVDCSKIAAVTVTQSEHIEECVKVIHKKGKLVNVNNQCNIDVKVEPKITSCQFTPVNLRPSESTEVKMTIKRCAKNKELRFIADTEILISRKTPPPIKESIDNESCIQTKATGFGGLNVNNNCGNKVNFGFKDQEKCGVNGLLSLNDGSSGTVSVKHHECYNPDEHIHQNAQTCEIQDIKPISKCIAEYDVSTRRCIKANREDQITDFYLSEEQKKCPGLVEKANKDCQDLQKLIVIRGSNTQYVSHVENPSDKTLQMREDPRSGGIFELKPGESVTLHETTAGYEALRSSGIKVKRGQGKHVQVINIKY